MKHKLIQLIAVIVIAAFAWQPFANACLGESKWHLRPVAVAERKTGMALEKKNNEDLISIDIIKKILCRTVLEEMGGSKKKAALALGIAPRTLSIYLEDDETALSVLSSEEMTLFRENGRFISIHKLELMLYRLALDITNGNQEKAAKLLGVHSSSVSKRVRGEEYLSTTLDAAWKVKFVTMLVKRNFFREKAEILDNAEALGINLDIVYEHILESRADIVTNREGMDYDIVTFIEWIEREKIVKEAGDKRLSREEYKEWLKQYVRRKTQEFQEALRQGLGLNAILPEAFAVFRQAALNTIGLYPTPEQVLAAIAIHGGAAVEMLPGEGKTLSIAMAAYLNALTGKGVHIHTFNDYLARRDGQNMGTIFDFLGLTTGVVVEDRTFVYGKESKKKSRETWVKNLAPVRKRQDAYQCDITYGEKDEFIFDYLRDNLVSDPLRCRQRRQMPEITIVDEGDNALIDDGYNPLILTGPPNGYAEGVYRKIYDFANKPDAKFKKGEDYRIDPKNEEVEIVEESARWKIEDLFDDIPELERLDYEEKRNLVRQALKAGLFFHKDEDYVVRDGKITIVDEFTGRCKTQHMWSNHLHQFVEVKEGIQVSPRFVIGGIITYQSYYRRIKRFAKLSCVSGTIGADAKELEEVYGLRTVGIHAQKRSRRINRPAKYYDTDEERDNEIERRVIEIHNTGNPILVFTSSIKAAHEWGERLSRAGVECNIIDGQNSAKEAEVIGKAGNMWEVTVATNAPGRGDHIEYGKGVEEKDGLAVIMTFMNKNRRADEQLLARTARRGEPGWTETYLSYQGELIERFGMDKPQEKSEEYYKRLRARTLGFDEELDKSREEYYRLREVVLYSGLAKWQRERILTNMDGLWLIFLNKLDEIKYSGTIEQYREFNQAEFSSLRERILHGRRIRLASLMPEQLVEHGFGSYLAGEAGRPVFASDLVPTKSMAAESSILRPRAVGERRQITKVADVNELLALKLMKDPHGRDYYKERYYKLERQYLFKVGPGGRIIRQTLRSPAFKELASTISKLIKVKTGHDYYMDGVQMPLVPVEGACGPCAFAVFYNCETKKTLVIHSFGREHEPFFNVLPSVPTKIGDDKRNIVVYIGGNAVLYTETVEEVEQAGAQLEFLQHNIERRNEFIEELKRRGYSTVITAFPKKINREFHTIFDPSNGLFNVFEMASQYATYPLAGEMDIGDYLKWLASITKSNFGGGQFISQPNLRMLQESI